MQTRKLWPAREMRNGSEQLVLDQQLFDQMKITSLASATGSYSP
jgi:hypothetical protein